MEYNSMENITKVWIAYDEIECPYCKKVFNDSGYWEGCCPTCGHQWHRHEIYQAKTHQFICEIFWEGQDL